MKINNIYVPQELVDHFGEEFFSGLNIPSQAWVNGMKLVFDAYKKSCTPDCEIQTIDDLQKEVDEILNRINNGINRDDFHSTEEECGKKCDVPFCHKKTKMGCCENMNARELKIIRIKNAFNDVAEKNKEEELLNAYSYDVSTDFYSYIRFSLKKEKCPHSASILFAIDGNITIGGISSKAIDQEREKKGVTGIRNEVSYFYEGKEIFRESFDMGRDVKSAVRRAFGILLKGIKEFQSSTDDSPKRVVDVSSLSKEEKLLIFETLKKDLGV